MLRIFLSACSAFLCFLLMHLLYFHFVIPLQKVNSLLLTALLGGVIFIAVLYGLPEESRIQNALCISDKTMKYFIAPTLGLFIYALLFVGYLEFYFTADRSITFRMLMITDNQPTQSITRDKMFAQYDIPGIIDKRFDDLVYGGYLNKQNKAYRLTTKGKLILSIYRFAINYLHLDNGLLK